MPKRVVLIDSAKNDIREARDWYRKQVEGLDSDFLNEVLATFDRIASAPEQFAVVYRQIRQRPIHRFPYVVSYVTRQDDVVVLAVLHGRRRPNVWKRRKHDDV